MDDELVDALLGLITETELGARAAPGGLERWVLDCAGRGVAANIERMQPEAAVLRAALDQAGTWLARELDELELERTLAPVEAAVVSVWARAAATTRFARRRSIERAGEAGRAVVHALVCVARRPPSGHAEVARLARATFPATAREGEAQARRLLAFTKLLPSGAELLVRLDYAESIGATPSDPDQQAWLEAQRAALMAEDESARMAVIQRHLRLVYAAELGC